MTSQSSRFPLTQFSRVTGRYGTLTPFVTTSDSNQETVGLNDSRLSLTCFHTKLYTRDNATTVHLDNGLQDGQIKKMTLVFKGKEKANMTVECPSLPTTYSEIVFSEVGDQAVLMWTGDNWTVLETLNITDPVLQSPWVQ